MKTRIVNHFQLDGPDASPFNQILSRCNVDPKEFFAPKPDKDSRYITSEATLDSNIDKRIFAETQFKRACHFFSEFFINKIPFGISLGHITKRTDYFSENEDLDPAHLIYKNHPIEKMILNDFKVHNLGHATQLIQTEGMNILTDPVFGNLAPIFYPSMTRAFNFDIGADKLPKIDVILTSHNHRDHVDNNSLTALIASGQQPIVLVPNGDEGLFKQMGFKTVIGFDWHENITVSESKEHKIDISSTPADHRSGRYGYDAHKALVSGWLISPKNRNEILYFAGDTARLNDTRLMGLAANIYATYKMKHTAILGQHSLPKIINLVPGGPNYTRKDMKPTHQSAVDSVALSLRLALVLEKISKENGENTKASEWLNAITSIFMHHNRFQLGPDRFNENIFIFNRMISYLKMDENSLRQHWIKQQAKSERASLFRHRKDFIIEGVEELKLLAKSIWPDRNEKVNLENLVRFILSRTHFPRINEKFSSSQVFENTESTMKPMTGKGCK